MNIKINKKIGNNTMQFEVDEKNDKDSMAKATFFMEPDVCGKCHSIEVIWQSNKAKTDDGEFTYIKRRCLKCFATSTMGEYKSGGYFWKEWEHYVKKDVSDAEQTLRAAGL